ncbi:glycoside hydrolase family 9 protein [Sphingomonas sp. LB-2]|uniref:glycoside hydrolase family 9 protein n=1 Tax=Sphingomonas caeni TaxID=2984949 RepID=UPI00222E1D83|nr:glycoside hydrolase family 9 protein [Sphingomonas caeni]MCW3847423.1 glycoside hydrolase family 9 protein [Sphingomonas caeni]
MRLTLTALALCLALPAAAQVADPIRPIRLNQTGFETLGPKRAMLGSAAHGALDWQLLDARGGVVLRGRTAVFGQDAASGENVHVIDFTAWRKAGKGYRLKVVDMESRSFDIGLHPRGNLAADAAAFFYHQRAGIPIEARFVGATWARPAGHATEIAPCFAGKDLRGNDWPGCPYKLDVRGGWYDAGDQGKYLVNGGISLWTLMNAHYSGGWKAFPDRSLRIPEAGNGRGDLLDEIRWEMDFFLRMQVPEGTKLSVPVNQLPRFGPPGGTPPPPLVFTEIDASGMAHAKVADRNWTKLPTAPADDKEERVIYPPTTGATLNLAATAAECARIFGRPDPAYAAKCLKAAERAWAAAKRNPQIYATGAFTGSGGYGDGDVSDEFFWAAAQLYAATGKAEYREAYRASPHWTAELQEASWGRTATLGMITIATAKDSPAEDASHAWAAITAAADRFLADETRTGYRVPYNPPAYPWGSTSSLLNRAMLLAMAYDHSRDRKYRDAVIDSVDYLLGRNPIDQSYVSGYGARPMRNPHHRFWAHQLDPKLPGPPPGVLSGGPNSGFMSEEVRKAIGGPCAPMGCYKDDINLFTMNEVAINWNAPLFWVAAWLDATA